MRILFDPMSYWLMLCLAQLSLDLTQLSPSFLKISLQAKGRKQIKQIKNESEYELNFK